MYLPRKKFLRALLSLALTMCVANGARAGLPPGSNFDLSHWKLELPVDVVGGTTGVAAEISAGQLSAGFTNNYFYSGADGAMTFWCPVTGATTSGSTYPRSELRELLNPNDASVNWLGTGTHILRAQCKVTQQPSAGAIIIGQVHGYSYSQRLVKLQFNNGVVQAYVRNSPTVAGDTKFTYPSVALNGTINYEIKVLDGVASIAVNGVTNSFNFFASDPAWQTINYYFKAGSYVQDNIGTDTEGGRVAFYQLSVTHGTTQVVPPAITTHPLSQTVATNGRVTLTATASGTAPLSYQWRADSIAIPGATNASLSFTNFRASDQKRYDVVVMGAGGSVTSAVANLYLNAPLRFTNRGVNAGHFSALLLGVANSNYVVETSSDMVRWTPMSTNSSPTGIINFTDPNPMAGIRYFRAR